MPSGNTLKRRVTPINVMSPIFYIGILDGSVAFAFLFGLTPAVWYLGTLIIKLVLAVIYNKIVKRPTFVGGSAIASILLMFLASTLNGVSEVGAWIQSLGFLVHLSITMIFVNRDNYQKYFRGISNVTIVLATIHIIYAATGRVADNYGRYLYLGNSHPNLGGEIASMGAFSFALASRSRLRVFALLLFLLDCFLMQARSAMISIFIILLLTLIFPENEATTSARVGRRLTIFSMVSFLIVPFNLAKIGELLNQALLLNNEFRGTRTGFSGRTELWQYAIDLFKKSPITGYEIGYFNKIGYIGPHNIVLFGLSQFGLTVIPFFVTILIGYIIHIRRGMYGAMLAMALLPLLLFNDRLININLYPFALYIFLFSAYPLRELSAYLSGQAVFRTSGSVPGKT